MSMITHFFKNLFIYQNKNEHSSPIKEEPTFVLSENKKAEETSTVLKNQLISSSFDKNLEFMKVRFNRLINSDIIFREFCITASR